MERQKERDERLPNPAFAVEDEVHLSDRGIPLVGLGLR
jgi:hypothetical protein